MRCRWPFAAALVALVGGLGVAAAAPDAPWWPTPEEQREMKAFERAFARAQPAAELLVGLQAPTGTAPCAFDGSASDDFSPATLLRRMHHLCWEGEAEALLAAASLAANLRAVGATEVNPRCVERGPQKFVLCRVTASVMGESFTASLLPRPERGAVPARFSGVFISGGVGEQPLAVPDLPLRGTPVPVAINPQRPGLSAF